MSRLFLKLVSRCRAPRTKFQRRFDPNLRHITFGLETLEQRRLLAFTGTVVGATATLIGDNASDTFDIFQSGGLLAHGNIGPAFNSQFDFVSGDGAIDTTVPALGTSTLNINTGGGNDNVFLGTPVAPASTILAAVVFNPGTGNDRFVIQDTGNSVATAFQVTANTTLGPGVNVTFAGAPVAAERTLALGSGSNTVTVLSSRAGENSFISTGSGIDSVSIGNAGSLAGIAGLVQVQNVVPGVGQFNLTINDSADVIPRSVSLDGISMTGLSPAPIAFGFPLESNVIGSLQILGGSGGNIYSVLNTPANLLIPTQTLLNSGSGNDIVNVFGTARESGASLSVSTGNGQDVITVGGDSALLNSGSGSLAGLRGQVFVDAGSGVNQLNVDGSGDAFALTQVDEIQTVTLGGNPISGTFTLTFSGMTTNNIPFNATAAVVQNELEALLNIGVGNVSVVRTGAAPNFIYTVTFINALGGANRPQLSSVGTFMPLSATIITATSQDGFTIGPNPVAVVITSSQITANSGFLPISYAATGGTFGNGVNVFTGPAADQVFVQSTLAGVSTIVNTNGGDDDVFISSDAPLQTGDLSGLLGPLFINAGPGDNSLDVSEAGNSTPDTVTITSSQIASAIVPFTVNYAATGGTFDNFVNFRAGSAGDTVTVASTLAGAPVFLDLGGGVDTLNAQAAADELAVLTGPGDDIVNISSNNTLNTGTLAGFFGGFTGNNRVELANLSGNDTLNVGNGGDTSPADIFIRQTEIGSNQPSRDFLFFLFGSFTTINVTTGSAADDVRIDSTVLGQSLFVSTTGGLDVVFVGSPTTQFIEGPVNIANLAAQTRITIVNTGDTIARNVSITGSGVTGIAPAVITYSAAQIFNVGVSGGTGNDTYNVVPQLFQIQLNNTFTGALTFGDDTLNVDLTGVTGPLLRSTPPASFFSAQGPYGDGRFTFTNRNLVDFTNLRHFSTSGTGNLAAEIVDTRTPSVVNNFSLSRTGANVTVNDGSVTFFDIPFNQLNSLLVGGMFQQREIALTVDFAGGPVIPPNFTFDDSRPSGGGPAGTLILQGGAFASSTYNFTNAHDGTIALAGANPINYLGLTPITDNLNVANRVFTFNNGDDVATLGDDPIAGNNLLRLSTANVTSETVDFTTPSLSLTVNLDNGSTGNDSLTLSAFDSLSSITGAVTINGGQGDDTINLLAATAGASVVVNGNADNDTINVGALGSQLNTGVGVLANLLRPIAIDAGAGVNQLNVDGSATATPENHFVNSNQINSTTLSFPLVYLASGGTFGSGVNFFTGSGTDSVTVQSTLAGGPTNVFTNGGDDGFAVTSVTNTLTGFNGPLNIDAGTGALNTMNVNESGSLTADSVVFSSSQIASAVVPFTINYTATGGVFGTGIGLATGSGSDSLTFLSTPVGAPISVFTNAGNDTIEVRSVSSAVGVDGGANDDTFTISSNGTLNTGTLAGIYGINPVTVFGNTGIDILNIADGGNASPTLINGGILGIGSPTPGAQFSIGIQDAFDAVNLTTGSAVDTVTIDGTAAGQSLFISTTGGSDFVNVRNNVAINGPINVANLAGQTTLDIDSLGAIGRNVTINSTGVTGLEPAAITYNAAQILAVNVEGGTGNETFNVVPSSFAVVLNGLPPAGVDTINLDLTSVAPGTTQTHSINGIGGAVPDGVFNIPGRGFFQYFNVVQFTASGTGTYAATVDDRSLAATDNFRLLRSGANLQVELAGSPFYRAPFNDLSGLTIGGAAQQATAQLTLDFSGGAIVPPNFVFDNSLPTPRGSLILQGGAFTSSTYNFTNANDGTIALTGTNLVTYLGLAPITDNLNVANRVFTFNNGSDVATLGDDPIVGNNLLRISTANVTSETVDFTTPTQSLTVNLDNGGTGNDSLTMTAFDSLSVISGSISLLGGDGDDVIAVTGPVVAPTLNIDGGLAATVDTVTLNGGGAAMSFDTATQTVNGGGLAAVSLVSTEVANLNAGAGAILLLGSAGTDTFDVTPTSATQASVAVVSSGQAINTTNTATVTIDLVTGNDTVSINGTAAADTINVASNSVTIAGLKSIGFIPTSLDLLRSLGLGGNDTFNLTPLPTTNQFVDGGAGTDVLNFAPAGGLLYIPQPGSNDEGSFTTAGRDIDFDFLESVVVTGATGVTINGSSGPNAFDLDAIDASALAGADGVQDFVVQVDSGLLVNFINTPVVQLNPFFGNDAIAINLRAPNGVASGLQIGLTTGPGPDTLVATNANSTVPENLLITNSQFSSPGAFTLNYSTSGGIFSSIDFVTGSAADSVNIQSTFAGAVTNVVTGGGDDTIRVSSNAPLQTGNLAGLAGQLVIDAGPGSNQLNVSDAGSAVANSVTLSATQIVGSTTPFLINYSASGGTFGGGASYSAGSGNDTITVLGTPAGVPTTINGGDGGDLIDVRGISSNLHVDSGNGNDTITLSSDGMLNTGTLAGFYGPNTVTLNNSGGSDTLNVGDGGNTTGNTTSNTELFILSNSIFDTTGPETYSFALNGLFSAVNLTVGSAFDLLFAPETPAGRTLSISTTGGDDVVQLGSAAQALDGPVNVVNLSGQTFVQIVNAPDTVGRTVSITPSGVTGIGPAPISYSAAHIRRVDVVSGSGNDVYNVVPASFEINLDNLGVPGLTFGDDSLNLDLSGVAGAVQQTAPPPSFFQSQGPYGDGVFFFSNRSPVSYNNLRHFNTNGTGTFAAVIADSRMAAGPSNLSLVRSGANLTASSGGQSFYDVPFNQLNALTIGGASQATNVSLTLDFSGGPIIPPNFLFDLSESSLQFLPQPLFSLILQGGNFSTSTYDFPGGANGSLTLTGLNPISFAGGASISDSLPAANRVFNYLGVANSITLQDDTLFGSLANGVSLVLSNNAPPIVFSNPTSALTINGGDMGNDIAVDSLDPDLAAQVSVFGGAAADTLVILGTIGLPILLDGKDGGDSYFIETANLSADVNIDDSGSTAGDSVSIDGASTDDDIQLSDVRATLAGSTVNYQQVELVTASGLDGSDRFVVTPSATVAFAVEGDAPDFGEVAALIGDVLEFESRTDDFEIVGNEIRFAGMQPVSFSGIDSYTVQSTLGPHALAQGVALQNDGKFVVAGYVDSTGGDYDFNLVRYKANGGLDRSFGTSGVRTLALSPGNDGATAVAIQPDGKIVAAGYTTDQQRFKFAVARFNKFDGSLDSSFGTNGTAITPVGAIGAVPFGVAIGSDGSIIVAGFALMPVGDPPTATRSQFVLVKYDADGDLDTSFAGDGVLITDFLVAPNQNFGVGNGRGYGLAVQSDGRILVGLTDPQASGSGVLLARFTESGALDPTFGTGGIVTDTLGPGINGVTAILLQPSAIQPQNQSIVFAGYSNSGAQLVRLDSSGNFDLSFGSPVLGNLQAVLSLTSDMSTGLVATGPSSGGMLSVVHVLADGSLDPMFGSGGQSAASAGAGTKVVVQDNGKIVAAGFKEERGVYRFMISQILGELGGPIASDDVVNLPAGAAATTIDVLANDKAQGGTLDEATLTILPGQEPTSGTATVNPDGTITYTPAPGFVGTDTFGYSIDDDLDDGLHGEATVTVNVGAVFGQLLVQALDVNHDGDVSAIDALLVKAALNTSSNSFSQNQFPANFASPKPTASPLDVSGDGYISGMDMLLVLAYLNEPRSRVWKNPSAVSTTSALMPASTNVAPAAQLAVAALPPSAWELLGAQLEEELELPSAHWAASNPWTLATQPPSAATAPAASVSQSWSDYQLADLNSLEPLDLAHDPADDLETTLADLTLTSSPNTKH